MLLPLLVFLINFNYLALNYGFVRSLQQKINSDITLENRLHQTDNIISYFKGREVLDQSFYSEQARLHLGEVKDLLTAITVLITLNIIVVLLLIIIIVHEKDYESIFIGMLYSCLAGLGFFFLLGFTVSNFFDPFFLSLHKLIFTDNLWLFPSTDTLVRLFPSEYFELFAKKLVINTVVVNLALIILSLVGVKLIKKPASGTIKNN